MGRGAAKKKDPNEALMEEIADAAKAGKTELSIDSPSDEALEALFRVTTLKQLSISGLKTLPPGIGNLTQLERLNLENNALTTLPKEIGKLDKLESFHVYSNQLTKLPDEIGGLVSLKKWVIWSNQLTSLPETLGELRSLVQLEVKWNKLRSLPESLGRLANLEELDAEDNELSSLPKDLSGMKKLRVLKLGANKLKEIPEAVFALTSLQQLFFRENQIKEIPDGIARLGKLRELGLKRNRLETLPEALFTTNIQVLHLKENKLREIPKGIGGMRSLIAMSLEENPLKGMPADVISGGKDAVFVHLGLVKPRMVEGDFPDQETRVAITKERKEDLEEFVRSTRRRLTDEAMRDKLLAFLNGKSNQVPVARISDHYSFESICKTLAPYEKWSFIDRRIIAYITQSTWFYKQPGHDYDSGYYEDFLRWTKEQVEGEKDEQLFAKLAGEVLATGVDAAQFTRQALMYLCDVLRVDDKLSSFGRWLLAKTDLDGLLSVAAENHGVREKLIPLLMENAPALFEKAAPTLLALTPDEDGEVHLPDAALMALCKKDPARWEALLFEGLEKIGDCMPCGADGLRILAECYPQKHADKALALTADMLKRISERRNQEEHFDFRWSGQQGYDDATANFIEWALTRFGAKIRPAVLAYASATKRFSIDVAEVVGRALGQDGLDIVAEGLDMRIESDDIAPHFRRLFAILAPLDWSKYHGKAWELARSEFNQARQTACLALGRLPAAQVVPKAKELLASKKGDHREAGVRILSLLESKEARALLDGLMDSESNDDARDLVVQSLYRDAQKIDQAEVARRVASADKRGKLESPVAKWLDEKKLPPLTMGKKKLDPTTLRFLLQRQTRTKSIAADPEARDVYPLITRAGAFAEKLLGLVLKNGGANAKNRFALALVGLAGDDSVIETLEKLAIDGRNVNAVETLGLLGTKEAARALDRIVRAFRVKYPNVRESAKDAFAAIAESMGMTPFELSDAMLPDFGFVKGKRTLKAGKRVLDVVIGADRKVALAENGTVLKSPPKEVNAKQKDELKALSAEVKEASRALKASLEYYMIVQRRWSAADWKAFFLGHPLANAFAQSLVWSSFEGRKLAQSFRVGAGGELLDVDGNKVTLGASIGLVHPLELAERARAAWQSAIDAARLTPPFAQMARPVFAVPGDEKQKTLSHQFDDREVNSGTFKSRAERLGWRRGSVVDSGEVSAYRKTYAVDQIEVFVRAEGLSVQSWDFDQNATVRDFFFVKAGSVVTGSYTYDEPRDAADSRLIKFGGVPAIVYSETVGDLQAIVKQKDEDD